ncbi:MULTISPECIES: DinB family protein [Paenibacillus]|nr:DinB family protein [Paenibacillus anaericanus]
MEDFIFRQITFVRGQTLKLLDGITEEMADQIPEGFRNNIRWNLGHVYVVLERLAFHFSNQSQQLPDGYKEQFGLGTSPLSLPESVTVPTLHELKTLLQEQPERIRAVLSQNLQVKADPPYTTSSGMTLETPEQLLSFSIYHEGMHISTIKMYKKLLSN